MSTIEEKEFVHKTSYFQAIVAYLLKLIHWNRVSMQRNILQSFTVFQYIWRYLLT